MADKIRYLTIIHKVLDASIKTFPIRHMVPAVQVGREVVDVAPPELQGRLGVEQLAEGRHGAPHSAAGGVLKTHRPQALVHY